MNNSARRTNKLAMQLGARRYLEIGVFAGATFRDIDIAERTGVDPTFRFDTNELRMIVRDLLHRPAIHFLRPSHCP
jgi:hypothetical protein